MTRRRPNDPAAQERPVAFEAAGSTTPTVSQRESAANTKGAAMALSDRATNPPPAIHGTPCSIGTLLEQLEGAELDAFQHMLSSRDWNATAIYDAVRDEGYSIGRQSINRHRRQACRCYKAAA